MYHSDYLLLEIQHTNCVNGWWNHFLSMAVFLMLNASSHIIYHVLVLLLKMLLRDWKEDDASYTSVMIWTSRVHCIVIACCILHKICKLHNDSFKESWLKEADLNSYQLSSRSPIAGSNANQSNKHQRCTRTILCLITIEQKSVVRALIGWWA